ncbi:hypothetical protein WR25_00704 [Diploscapter pachys]|uniref:Uncharacterized protein n=1 Tax=Diploscapter pachys TaxID=2018661 RepID=A0A2A2M1Y4_9BILA|nr:hypothetical protein WR25_00704 [Diploscapter pachys]
MDRGAAAAEGVEHDVAFVGRGGDDAFEQFDRLLRGVAEIFLAARCDGEVPIILWHLALGVDQVIGADEARSDEAGFIVFARLGAVFDADGVGVEGPGVALVEPEDRVVLAHELPHAGRPRPGVAPDDFVAVALSAEHRVEQQLEIMAGGRIAVEEQAAGRLELTMQFDQADRHHGEIGHHVVFAEERAHRPQQFERARVAALADLVEGILRRVVPVPRVFERLDLGIRAGAGVCSALPDCAGGSGDRGMTIDPDRLRRIRCCGPVPDRFIQSGWLASAGPPRSPRRAEAVPPACLRPVQRIVGAGDDVAQAIGGRDAGDAAADAEQDVRRGVGGDRLLAQCGLDARADRFARVVIADLQDHHELVATQPADQIIGTGVGAQRRGEVAQHVIAEGMAPGIVDALEVIDVDRDAAQGRSGAIEQRAGAAFEAAAVEQPGERVGDRLGMRFGGLFLKLARQAGARSNLRRDGQAGDQHDGEEGLEQMRLEHRVAGRHHDRTMARRGGARADHGNGHDRHLGAERPDAEGDEHDRRVQQEQRRQHRYVEDEIGGGDDQPEIGERFQPLHRRLAADTVGQLAAEDGHEHRREDEQAEAVAEEPRLERGDERLVVDEGRGGGARRAAERRRDQAGGKDEAQQRAGGAEQVDRPRTAADEDRGNHHLQSVRDRIEQRSGNAAPRQPVGGDIAHEAGAEHRPPARASIEQQERDEDGIGGPYRRDRAAVAGEVDGRGGAQEIERCRDQPDDAGWRPRWARGADCLSHPPKLIEISQNGVNICRVARAKPREDDDKSPAAG